MSAPPTVTVEVTPRQDVVLRTMFSGLIAGLLLVLAPFALSLTPIAIGTSLELTTAVSNPWVWHLIFSVLFGGVFGVLVHSRPLWHYGRGFLGPIVGLVFGVLAWGAAFALIEPLWFVSHGIATTEIFPVYSEMSLVTYAVYGTLVGLVSNVVP
ncbi:hypothetical protein [Haloarchaeobius sp. DYHT-AS-18]|uniref:hypothetical protein n=1 Tax=Haloarchaeobius sp. DYHT-AS-18 TaxID=3446117 RepID=UPI003EB7280D